MDLNLQFNALNQNHQLDSYPSYAQRKKIILLIKKALQSNSYHLVEAINKDFGYRSEKESLLLEILPIIKAIKYCLANMKKWMKKRSRHVPWVFLPAKAYLHPQPLGVIGVMVPWNYPVNLALIPAIYAIAAGNRVMIKMSELSVNTGLALQKLIDSLNINHFIQIVAGDAEIAKEFSALPFGHLLFTGSTSVGKLVMSNASNNLTPLTLELGGKSPALISSSINNNYFKRLFMGKFFNAAQTCIAPDYLLIPDGWKEKIECELKHFINIHYPDLMNNKDYSSIISAGHKQRLLDLVEDARHKGADIVQLGELNSTNKLPVYLIFGATREMRVMQEEIFGPILPVLNYLTFDKALEMINSLPNPLVFYYFGENKEEILLAQNKTLSGALTINDTIMHMAIDDLPFGGVGMSGMGHYHGREGFDTFSKLKPVFIQSRFSTIPLSYPPYGIFINMLLKILGGIKGRKQ